MVPVKTLAALPLDHELMLQDQVADVIDAFEVQEEQLAVLLHMLLGADAVVRLQDGREEPLLKNLDLVLVKVQLTHPVDVILVKCIE